MPTNAPPAVELGGKVAVVTGAARGIGRAIAAELGSAGAAVLVADLHGADEAAAELCAGGLTAVGLEVDVASQAATREMSREARARFGGVDILVNNAGLFGVLKPRPFEEIDFDEWRRVMDVNLGGCFLTARALVPLMRERGGGRIVNMASTSSFKGVANLLHYVASKGGVVALTRALARELGADGILVNAVAPGFTVTDGVIDNPAGVDAMRRAAPGNRMLQREEVPSDIVGVVRFLCGPAAGFITGQTIVVDGGAYFN